MRYGQGCGWDVRGLQQGLEAGPNISELQMTCSKLEALSTLEILMAELAYVGLCLSAGTTPLSTNEVEPRTRQRCWTNGWAAFCQLGPMDGQFWTRLIMYRPPQGQSLPINRFSVTRRFVSQCDFVSLTGSLHRLPFFWSSNNPDE